MLVRAFYLSVYLSIFMGLLSFDVNARTWPIESFHKDPGANVNHVFGVYQPVDGYQDPDFESALINTSPFLDQRFESYDLAVIIDIQDSRDAVNESPIQGQTIRIYSRENVLAKIPYENLQSVTYDKTTGLLFYWKTSTARRGKSTPRGYFTPQSFSSDHRSSLYNDAPMPWAVFFNGRIATHGVLGSALGHLGKIASAGCARLEPQRGKDLFQLIGITGKDWVDKIDVDGNLLYNELGEIVQEENYKTLIVVQ